MKVSPILRGEIERCNISQNEAIINFKGRSYITTRVSNDNSRSARANILIVDEARMVDETILNTVLRKFLTSPRHPKYLDNPKYANLQERNKEIYMSSAYFKSSYLYRKSQGYVVNMLDDKRKYFICALPYQLSIREGLLLREQVEDERSEPDWNELKDSMEMECLWYGDTDGSLFRFDDINKTRRIRRVLMPLKYYSDSNPVPKLSKLGHRVMSVDVALMASSRNKKNDAASIKINDAIQMSDTAFQSNYIYGETFEGLTTDELGIVIMRYFYHYGCTDLVIDTNGLGIGVADYIVKNQFDPETGETYKALTFINNEDMAMRCKVKDANKVVWSVKATAAFNNEAALLLRTNIQNGKINTPISENDCEEAINDEFKGYKKLSPTDKAYAKIAYADTTMTVYELIKLKSYINNGNIVVKEQSGMRKDRYSSMAYNNWCVTQLELQLKPKQQDTESFVKNLTIRRGRIGSRLL